MHQITHGGCINQSPCLLHPRIEEQVVVHTQRDPCCLGFLVHGMALFGCHGHGLLNQHVMAAPQGSHGNCVVSGRRGQHVNNLGLRLGVEFLRVVEGGNAAVLLRQRRGGTGLSVQDSRHPSARHFSQGPQVKPGDVARADNPDSHSITLALSAFIKPRTEASSSRNETGAFHPVSS